MQGECSKAPSAQLLEGLEPGLQLLRPRQCIVLTNAPFIDFSPSTHTHLVMDNLYMRVQQYTGYENDQGPGSLIIAATSSIWISNTSIQGDRGGAPAFSIYKNAALHISGTVSTAPICCADHG